jgi:aspartate/methionine/tyrosine aminotransferase
MYDKFAQRITSNPTSIFAVMSEMAWKHKAVNLGQGFPNIPGPQFLKDAAAKAIQEDKNQYAPAPGIYSLRKAISEVNEKFYGVSYHPDKEITVTAGATEALFSTIMAFIEQGDEVVMFEPFYDAHEADVLLAGGIPKYVTLHKPGFTFTEEEIVSQISDKTKMIIINTPHNPTGKVFSKEELELIAKIAKKHDLLVLSDEVYEYLTFDAVKHISIASLDGMRERTITISSTGKTFGMTGWKVGYICSSELLTEAVRKIHQWTTFTINTPGQHAVKEGFLQFDSYLPDFQKLYQAKKDLAFNMLSDSIFKPHACFGTYFLMVDLPDKFTHDVEAAEVLIKEYGVATIPPSCFYKKSDEGKTMLRVCFAKDDETLKEGLKRIQSVK